jgi:hypothetical protein
MRAMTKILVVGTAAVAMAACRNNQSDQNIAIDNTSANSDIETLPPDESSETPSNELVNGSDNPDVSDLNASANTY